MPRNDASPPASGATLAEGIAVKRPGRLTQPICAAHVATVDGSVVHLDVLLASLDGQMSVRTSMIGTDPQRVGTDAATSLLDDHGGRYLLDGAA